MTRTPLLRPAAARTALLVICTLAALVPALPASATGAVAITGVSPTVTRVGRTVTVSGTGLDDATAVSVNGTSVAATSTAPDGSSLTFVVPAGATTGRVSVTASGGSATSSGTLQVGPAPVTGLAVHLGARGLLLSWTGHGTGATRVRAVSGLTKPVSVSGGAAVPLTSATTAYDRLFTNTAPRSYAIYAMAADGTPSDTAATFTVTQRLPVLGTKLSLGASPATVLPGRTVTLTGRLGRTTGGLPLGGATVTVRKRIVGTSSYATVRTLTTATDGTVRATLIATRSVSYSLRYSGDAFSSPSSSTGRIVTMQPQVSAVLSAPSIVLRESTSLHGAVRPAYAGVSLVVQRYSGGAWHNVRSVRTTAAGTWGTILAPAVGRLLYRAVLPASASYLRATSPSRLLRIAPRVLVSGTSGADVLALERALARQHYFVGAQDGYFDSRLQHAVIAFEKVERLPRNGTWAGAERTRLVAPHGFRLRYPSSGKAVEVDVTRQVLVLSQGGRTVMIVDVSTGSERHYTQDGVDNIAHTPRGRFQVTRKIDGIRVSKLGELYRPSYFFQGYAVHGNGSVPTYNASHGCVRVTNPVADYLFPLLTVGTPLAVYDE